MKETLLENFACLDYIDQKNDHEINDTELQSFLTFFFNVGHFKSLHWIFVLIFLLFLCFGFLAMSHMGS